MAEWVFDQTTQVATVLAPDTSVTIQEVYNTFREYEDNAHAMSYPSIIFGGGKFDYGTGDLTVVSCRLIDWKLAFEARSGPTWTECFVTGGNLASVDSLGAAQAPIEGTAFVTVQYAQATTGALINADELVDIWTRLFGGTLEVSAVDAKELLYDAADVLYSEALVYGGDGTDPYDGTNGVVRRRPHIKP